MTWIRPMRLLLLTCALLSVLFLSPTRFTFGQADDPLGSDSNALDAFLDGEAAPEDTAEAQQPMTREEQQRLYEEAGQTAEQLMQEQKWPEAMEQYQKILSEINPGDPRALIGMGDCLRAMGANRDALDAYSRVMQSQYGVQFLPIVLLRRGEVYLLEGQYREAVDDLEQAISQDTSNAFGYYLLGKARLRLVITSPGGGRDESGQRDLALALTALTRSIELDPNFGEAYLERGRVLTRLRREDPGMKFAIADLEKATQLLGEGTIASAELGATVWQRANQESSRPGGDSQKIVADLRRAVKSFNAFLRQSELGKKTLPWEKVDPLDYQAESILLQRAQAFVSLANETSGNENRQTLYQAALEDCQALLDSEPGLIEEAQADFNRGQALRMMNDLPGAIAAYTKVIQAVPPQTLMQYMGGEPYLRRGICYFHQGEYEMALQDFQVAANNLLNPFQLEPRAMFWTGLTQAKQGDDENAIRSYTRAIRGDPDYLPAHLNRGLAYYNTGRFDRAIKEFTEVLRRDPDHATARKYRDLARQQSQWMGG